LNYWLERGAKRQNTVLGLATYGRSFTLADPLLNKVNSPSIGPGMAGPYTNRPGVIGFNEVFNSNKLLH
jgi:chitinase